jgi:EAL domain-containing protein (putative c-di-GMP-specific phosphodiesterase class I)
MLPRQGIGSRSSFTETGASLPLCGDTRLKRSGEAADGRDVVPTRTGSPPDCRPLLADPDDLCVVFRPVVDLVAGTVVGYEALARFPGTAGPDVWFAAAADAGLAASVEALLVHKALSRLPDLPAGCALVLPVRASLLASRPVRAAFAVRPRLDGVLVEMRPDTAEDWDARDAAALRARGAALALPADVRRPSSERLPDVVVLDREAVAASAASSGTAPGAPLVLADDIETPQDLTAALRCGGALGRGWVFGPPSAVPGPLPPSVTELLRTHRARIRLVDPVLPLVRPVHRVRGAASGIAPAVEVDDDGAPVALLVDGPAGSTWRTPVSLCVLPDAGAGETLRLALSRPAEQRHDPVLCTDEDGRPLGILRVADLVRVTAR